MLSTHDAYRGLFLNARTLGPFYRIVIRDRDEEGPILAVSSGFTVPAMGLMHCDSLEIFTRGCGTTLKTANPLLRPSLQEIFCK